MSTQRKYNRGHQVPQRWVFGGICEHGCGFLQEVPDRSAATLLPIIQRNIAPGTEIHRYHKEKLTKLSPLSKNINFFQ